MNSSQSFKSNLKYLEQNKIYANTGKDEWESIWHTTEPSAERINKEPDKILNNLFQSRISDDLIDIVNRNGGNSIGMVGYDNNNNLTEIDEDLFHEILYAIKKNTNDPEVADVNTMMKLNKNGYKEKGLPPIPFYMLKLVDRLGDKSIYKKMKSPDDPRREITITPKLYNVAQQAIIFLKNQYGDLASAEKAQYSDKETKMSTHKDFFTKLAEEGYDEMRTPLEEENEQLREHGATNEIQNAQDYFDVFIQNPTSDSFKQLLRAVSSELGEGPNDGRDETTELLQLAQMAGMDWITEQNIQFLYELFNV